MDNVQIGEITERNLRQLMKACKLTDASLFARRQDGKIILITIPDEVMPDPVIEVTTMAIKTGFCESSRKVDEIFIYNKRGKQ